ncbi:hypothetical protein [Rathayibacter sp. VKM Ac-2760]|uniref:O-antigen ligase family protein n=1 Tax=Rathayibacter sp. VKM Ac-2760 TaxID=2609253 RepID=UPI001315CA0D|nr:hypothetical protein GSU72_12665 [Rathayibacter sp. VKM Ac-2760]
MAAPPAPPVPRSVPRRSTTGWYLALLVLLLGGAVFWIVTGDVRVPLLAAGAAIVLVVARILSPAAAAILLVVLYAAVPFDYLPAPLPLPVLSPLILLAALLAVATGAPPPPWLRGIALLPAFTFALYALLIPILRPHGQLATVLATTAVLILALIAIPLRMSDPSVFGPLTAALLLVATVLALLGMVESATQSNAYAEIYASSPYPLTQEWSVYRILTTLGHPLVNSTFFASVGSLAFGLFLRGRRPGALLAFAACCTAVLLTGSRSGVAAIGTGMAIAGGLTVLRLTGSRFVRLALVVVPFAVIVAIVGPEALDARSSSEEGRVSAEVRDLVLRIALRLLPTESGIFGSGGGLSSTVFEENGGRHYALESSLWQLVLSYGLIGAVLLLGHLLIVLLRSIARGAIAGPAMLVAWVVSASAFNLLESVPAALIVPATAILLTLSEARWGTEGLGAVEATRGGEPAATHAAPAAEERAPRDADRRAVLLASCALRDTESSAAPRSASWNRHVAGWSPRPSTQGSRPTPEGSAAASPRCCRRSCERGRRSISSSSTATPLSWTSTLRASGSSSTSACGAGRPSGSSSAGHSTCGPSCSAPATTWSSSPSGRGSGRCSPGEHRS